MNNQRLTILMLGGARRVSLAELFKRSGRRLGCDVRIVSYDLTLDVPISLEGKVIKGLKWSDPDVVADIARVVETEGVDIILPFVNGAVEVAAACRVAIPGVFVPVSDPQTATELFDKSHAAKLFKEAGLPIPKTYSVLSAQLPAMAKPRKGGSSRGIHIFRNMDELMHLPDIQNYILQEYLEHCREYTVDAYISEEGRVLVTVPRERLEIMGGESSRTRTCRNGELERLTREVIDKFQLRGPVAIQFLHDLDADRYLLLEVNPRLGGGVICSIYAGAPITDYILQEARGVKPLPCTDWAPDTLMARYSKEAIFYNNK